MPSTTVYIVRGEAGEHADRDIWNVAVFTSRSEADQWCEKCQKKADALFANKGWRDKFRAEYWELAHKYFESDPEYIKNKGWEDLPHIKRMHARSPVFGPTLDRARREVMGRYNPYDPLMSTFEGSVEYSVGECVMMNPEVK